MVLSQLIEVTSCAFIMWFEDFSAALLEQKELWCTWGLKLSGGLVKTTEWLLKYMVNIILASLTMYGYE